MMITGLRALMLVLGLLAEARAETSDHVRYVVASRIVTASDILLEAVLAPYDRALLPIPGADDPEQRAVDMAILRERAGDAVIYRPSPSDVRARLDRLRAAQGPAWEGFLATWGLDERRLEGILFSRMVVERYVLRNAPRPTTPEGPSPTGSELAAWMTGQRTGLRVIAVAVP
jgi:hypothetical protein